MDSRPIAIFDSGVGGLTALKALREAAPNESVIYFCDAGRMPYGGRPRDEIIGMTRQILDFLQERDVKYMLAACGTMSTNSLPEIKDTRVPLTGVVEPSVDEALKATRNGCIGVVATEASVRSGLFKKALLAANPSVKVTEHACPGFAPMVEQGHFDRSDPIARAAVECEFEMLRSVGIDTLLLGCTHYPMLTELILDYLGDKLELVDAGAAAGFALPGKLRQLGIEAPSDAAGTEVFYTSGDTEKFESMAHMFLGRGIKAERRML